MAPQTINSIKTGLLPDKEPSVSSEYSEVELTQEEVQSALLAARKAKATRIYQEEQKRIHAEKMRQLDEPITCSAEQLLQWVVNKGAQQILNFRLDPPYDDLFELLAQYFTGDARFEAVGYSLNKGILLVGGVGTRKTSTMRLFSQNPRCSYKVVSCLDVASDYQRNGDEALSSYELSCGALYNNPFRHTTGGFCFDDLGTEPVSKHYGNECNTLQSIILRRYQMMNNTDLPISHRTVHMTTNLSADQIEATYDLRVRSRMREMFNLIEIPEGTPDSRG